MIKIKPSSREYLVSIWRVLRFTWSKFAVGRNFYLSLLYKLSFVFAVLLSPIVLVLAIKILVTPGSYGFLSHFGIYFLILLYGFLWFMSFASNIRCDTLNAKMKAKLSCYLNHAMMQHFTKQSLNYYLSTPTGAMIQRISQTYNSDVFVSALLGSVIALPFELFAVTALVCFFSLKIGILLLVFALVSISIAIVKAFSVRVANEEQFNEAMTLYGKILQMLGHFEQIHLFNASKFELSKIKSALEEYEMKLTQLSIVPGKNALINLAWISFGFTLILLFGAYSVLHASLSYGNFVMIILYASALIAPLLKFDTSFGVLAYSAAGLEQVVEFLSTAPLITEPEHPVKLAVAKGNALIEFNHVSFSYENEPVLKDVSFSIESGKKTAILGVSGAGKSSIARLLLRFWDPDEGEIKINNCNIKNLSLYDLRSFIAMVPQTPSLLEGDIVDNVRYARRDASDKDILEALKHAELNEFISSDGRHCVSKNVGESGGMLSGGQRQRVAIARVLLKNAPIFLLDEATTALDIETAVQVEATLDKISKGYTTIVITHQLVSVLNADKIILIGDGKLIAQGSFEALLKSSARFQKMVETYCDKYKISFDKLLEGRTFASMS